MCMYSVCHNENGFDFKALQYNANESDQYLSYSEERSSLEPKYCENIMGGVYQIDGLSLSGSKDDGVMRVTMGTIIIH